MDTINEIDPARIDAIRQWGFGLLVLLGAFVAWGLYREMRLQAARDAQADLIDEEPQQEPEQPAPTNVVMLSEAQVERAHQQAERERRDAALEAQYSIFRLNGHDLHAHSDLPSGGRPSAPCVFRGCGRETAGLAFCPYCKRSQRLQPIWESGSKGA